MLLISENYYLIEMDSKSPKLHLKDLDDLNDDFIINYNKSKLEYIILSLSNFYFKSTLLLCKVLKIYLIWTLLISQNTLIFLVGIGI